MAEMQLRTRDPRDLKPNDNGSGRLTAISCRIDDAGRLGAAAHAFRPMARAGAMAKRTDLIDKRVGQLVRMRRLMLDMSQERLGDAVGVAFQQIQKYENGVNRISASRLQRMSDVLKVPVPFFFEGTSESNVKGSTEIPEDVISFLATRDGVALVRAFMQIEKPTLRRCIVNMVMELRKREDD